MYVKGNGWDIVGCIQIAQVSCERGSKLLGSIQYETCLQWLLNC